MRRFESDSDTLMPTPPPVWQVRRPASVAVPFNVAVFGNVMVRSGPALTTGAWFCGTTVTVASSLDERSPSLALNLTTYVPSMLNEAVVTAVFGLLNVTVPGPLTLLQVIVR